MKAILYLLSYLPSLLKYSFGSRVFCTWGGITCKLSFPNSLQLGVAIKGQQEAPMAIQMLANNSSHMWHSNLTDCKVLQSLSGIFLFSVMTYSLSTTLHLKLPDPFRTHWRPWSTAGKCCSAATPHRPLFYSLKSSLSGNSQQVLSGNQSLSWATYLITIPGEETWKTDLCATVANLLSKGAPVSAEDHHSLITSHYQHNMIANWNFN